MHSLSDHLNPAYIYKIFFKILRAYYVLSALIALGLNFGSFDFFGLFLTGVALLVLGLQFYASFHAELLIEVKDHKGFLLGLLLGLLALPGYSFPVGLLGLYALLNKQFRQTHLPEALPEWLYNVLIKMDELLERRNFHADGK